MTWLDLMADSMEPTDFDQIVELACRCDIEEGWILTRSIAMAPRLEPSMEDLGSSLARPVGELPDSDYFD